MSQAAAETIENNVRKIIIDEQPLNPKYYEKMSELLDALIAQRKKEALDYQIYLQRIVGSGKEGCQSSVQWVLSKGFGYAGQAGVV